MSWRRLTRRIAASAGRGGVRRGSMNGSGSSETTESAIGLRTKALLVDRSHNPWREADRRAAYGKSVRAPRQSSTLRVARARAGAVLVRVVAAAGHGQDAGPPVICCSVNRGFFIAMLPSR